MFKPGDIILVQSRNWFGNVILWFMRKTDDDPVSYGHAAVIESENTILQARLKIERKELGPYLESCKHYKVLRYKNLTEEQASCIIKKIQELIDIPYGVPRLILLALDKITNTHWFTNLFKDERDQVCSSLVAWSFDCCVNGYDFNSCEWMSCDPDDIDDHSQKNPESWEVIATK